MKEQIKLFSVSHKTISAIPKGRVLIGVGTADDLTCFKYRDNTADNITQKNDNYCELTALYWIWKNIDADYIGFEHYRRFFCRKSLFKSSVLTQKKILKLLKTHDVILPKQLRAKPNIYDYYSKEHCKEDLDICLNIINSDYPEFSEAANDVMNSDKLSLFNMFVMPQAYVDEYCKWLFDILFKAERKIDLSDKDAYQRRVFGFLSERLFNVWLRKKNFNAYYAPVYNVGDCPLVFKFRGLFRRLKKFLNNEQ